jgi:hypothetical protein
MLKIASVDVGTALKQVPGNLYSRGEVQGHLAIPATCGDYISISSHEFPQPVNHPESRRRMRIQPGPSFDQESSQLRKALVEDSNSARPVVAARIDIGAGSK